MIDFTDVRRTKKETHYFFNAMFVPELTHFLDEAGVTDYRILKYEGMRTVVGKDNIPNVPMDLIDAGSMRATALLISHFRVSSLRKKIKKLRCSKEWREWQSVMSEESRKRIEKYYGVKIPK